VSGLDWAVLFGALAFFVGYGVWRSRGERDLVDFFLAGRRLSWPMVTLSVMATQASAITFLSTPGQAYADGLRFVQFYFGLPLAMVVLCATLVPIFHRLRVFTAYQYLQSRFDGKTRTLAAGLFLLQRALATGLTIYAPSLILSVILDWDIGWTCVLLGGLAVIYTTTGGSKAVSYTQALQFTIILATMAVAAVVILLSLPEHLSIDEASFLAGQLGRLNALELRFDPDDRYNLWSGLLGGFFLQLSYFGTDQSQVGRYLTGRSVAESRMGLLANGLVKVPMQLAILSLGVLVFVFYLFTAPPLFFDPAESRAMRESPQAAAWASLEARHEALARRRGAGLEALLAARDSQDTAALEAARGRVAADQAALGTLRQEAGRLIRARDPGASASDTNYVFLRFVLAYLPAGLVGLVFAAVFAASMNSISAELNALTSTAVVDVYQRVLRRPETPRRQLWVSRLVTLAWAAFAVGFAEYASRLGTLVEAVNILGSLFYGTLLGIFLVAFFLRHVGGTAVFAAALAAEAAVAACFALTEISFLWYNAIGCGVVVMVSLVLSARPARAA
jgi:Na+/proline symporter